MLRRIFTLIFNISPKIFSISIALFVFAFFAIIGSLNCILDPYYIFHKVSYPRNDKTLADKQRFLKPLQVVFQQPNTVILGSSRVYRGFNVEGDVYNMGISSLSLKEMSSYVDVISKFTRAKKIIIGLDLWMIDSSKPVASGWDTNTGTANHLVKSFLKALFDPKNVFTKRFELIRPNRTTTKAGWNYNGFYLTENSSKERIEDMLHRYMKNCQTTCIEPSSLILLDEIIEKCKKRNVSLFVYISPLHPKTKDVYKTVFTLEKYNEWRGKIKDICLKTNTKFYDFTDFLSDSTDLENGSNNQWLDYSHFTPEVGNRIWNTLQNL